MFSIFTFIFHCFGVGVCSAKYIQKYEYAWEVATYLGDQGIHDEGMQDSWPPCFLHTGASSNWACGTDGGADGDAGANLWFGNVELVCFVISSVSYYEGFLLLDVVGCYCCCWCWWWWHRKRTGRSSERNHKNEKVGTEEETEDPNRQKWTRKKRTKANKTRGKLKERRITIKLEMRKFI